MSNKISYNYSDVTMLSKFGIVQNLYETVFGGNRLTHDHNEYIKLSSDRMNVISRSSDVTNEMLVFTVVIPDKFEGNLDTFSDDLITSINFCHNNVIKLIDGVTVDVSSVLNNINDMKSHPPRSIVMARQASKELINLKKKMNGYFNGTTNHAELRYIVKTPADLESTLIKSATVSESLRWVNDDQIKSKAGALSELMTQLTKELELPERNSHENARTYNELLEETIVVSQLIEYYGYILAISLQYFNCLASATKQIRAELG